MDGRGGQSDPGKGCRPKPAASPLPVPSRPARPSRAKRCVTTSRALSPVGQVLEIPAKRENRHLQVTSKRCMEALGREWRK